MTTTTISAIADTSVIYIAGNTSITPSIATAIDFSPDHTISATFASIDIVAITITLVNSIATNIFTYSTTTFTSIAAAIVIIASDVINIIIDIYVVGFAMDCTMVALTVCSMAQIFPFMPCLPSRVTLS